MTDRTGTEGERPQPQGWGVLPVASAHRGVDHLLAQGVMTAVFARARVLEVLNSLNGRRAPVDGVPDMRTPARRNADALVEAMSCLTAAEARRLACDACIVPMVLGSDSMLLDVGRQHRLATTALRDALAQRDQGCAFPGCDRPPRYTPAHHIAHWIDWGKTTLDNMCLLCEYHHTIVHRQGWHIRLDARGHPEFIPPQTVDSQRRPLHNPLRQ